MDLQWNQAATPPRLLCRFRPVSENSLLQLQENKLYYSSADYYDDPFDTYFYIDLTNLKQFVETLKLLLASKDESVMKDLEAVAPLLNVSSELLVQSLPHTAPDYSELRGQLEVIRQNPDKKIEVDTTQGFEQWNQFISIVWCRGLCRRDAQYFA